MTTCSVCGGETRAAVFTARDDDDPSTMVALPGLSCRDCGSICPDDERIAAMCATRVPSSVRIRCLQVSTRTVEEIRTRQSADTIPAPGW
jgi:hypothetical protein